MNDSYLEKLSQQTITAPELISLLEGYQMLPQLYRELLIDQAIASREFTPEEIEQAKQEDPQQTTALATRKLRLEKFKQATWGHKLESYFLTQKAQLDQVTYSLLRTRDMALAQEWILWTNHNFISHAKAQRRGSALGGFPDLKQLPLQSNKEIQISACGLNT